MTTDTATAPPAEIAEAAAVPARVVEAWARHDAKAFSEVFTEDGTMILPGLFQKGRAAIEAHMAAAFEGPYKGTRVTGQPVDARLLSPTTAVVITRGGVLAPGADEVAEDNAVHGSWLVVKENGTWLLAAYQNSPR